MATTAASTASGLKKPPAALGWCLQHWLHHRQKVEAVVELGGDPWCEPCALAAGYDTEDIAAARSAKAAANKVVPHSDSDSVMEGGHGEAPEPGTGSTSGGTDSAPVHVNSQSPAVRTSPKESQPVISAVKVCGRPGCGKRLTDRNRSGFCTPHFGDSKRKTTRVRAAKADAPSVPQHVPSQVPIAATSGSAALSAPQPAAGAEVRVRIDLPVAMLDRWWQQLDAESKGHAFSLFIQEAAGLLT